MSEVLRNYCTFIRYSIRLATAIDFWEICLLTFWQRVRLADPFHSHIYQLNIKLQAVSRFLTESSPP